MVDFANWRSFGFVMCGLYPGQRVGKAQYGLTKAYTIKCIGIPNRVGKSIPSLRNFTTWWFLQTRGTLMEFRAPSKRIGLDIRQL